VEELDQFILLVTAVIEVGEDLIGVPSSS